MRTTATFFMTIIILSAIPLLTSAQSSCLTGADTPPKGDCNGTVEIDELLDYIDLWYSCSECVPDLFNAIEAYYGVPFCGDNACNSAETCSSCPGDCGTCSMQMTSQISHYGITWFFDKEYQYGTFANGDYWVVPENPGESVIITRITVVDETGATVDASREILGRTKHGSMIDPSPSLGTTQGYDNEMYVKEGPEKRDYDPSLNAALNVGVDGKTLELQPNTSLVSSISYPDIHRPQLRTASILTVLETPIQNDYWFRPPYVNAGKEIKYNKEELDRSLLLKLPPVPTLTPAFLLEVQRQFNRSWIDHVPWWQGRDAVASELSWSRTPLGYGRQFATAVGEGVLVLHSDLTDQQKESILIALVQLGIDHQGIIDDHGEDNFKGEGGFGQGRKFTVLFAGLMLDDPGMKNIGERSGDYMFSGNYGPGNLPPDYIYFGEDDQTFYVKQTGPSEYNYGYGSYTAEDVGKPEWNTRHSWRPQDLPWEGWCDHGYRYCCSAHSYAGFVLAAHLMDMKDLWNHNALFDYQDRYMDIEKYSSDANDGLCQSSLRAEERQLSRFLEEMWDAYREQYGCTWERDDQTYCTPANIGGLNGPCYSNGHYDCSGELFRCEWQVSSVGNLVSSCSDYTNQIACDYDPCNLGCGGSCEFDSPSNYKSGISVLFDGTPGVDYAEEYLYHDRLVDDHKVVYIKSDTTVVFEHNERNVVSNSQTCSGGSRIIGRDGEDGIPDSGDEGNIIIKVDRDRAFYNYKSYTGNAFIPYSGQFSFDDLEYEPGTPVVGTTGPSGPTYDDYHQGMVDSTGDEWHILTFWDNDADIECWDDRALLSDAKIISFVVNPKTPLISFDNMTDDAQFYTTPPKTYFVPVIHEQTTYLTDNIEIKLVNIMNSNPIYYRINSGPQQTYTQPLSSSNALNHGTNTLEYWYDDNHHKTRTIVKNPGYPSDSDVFPDGSGHGYLLWQDEDELDYIKQKLTREPYSTAYSKWINDCWNSCPSTAIGKYPLLERLPRRGMTAVPADALESIAYYTLSTADERYGKAAKEALLDLFVVDPVSGEQGAYETTIPPASPDRLGIPNSGTIAYIAAGIAYDLLIAEFNVSVSPHGVTPIEDYKIRDNLASQASLMMLSKIRNWGTDSTAYWGATMHYSLGYEMIAASLGMAMPGYDTPYYGTSGFDLITTASYENTPYPDQALTWHEILTDPEVETLGRPNLYSKSRFFTIYKNFSQLTDYYPDNVDLPVGGAFWVGANAFTCCNGMYPSGTPAASMDNYGCIQEDYDFDCSAVGLTKVITVSGTMCQKGGWQRSFNKPPNTDCLDVGDMMFHVEHSLSYESNDFSDYMIKLNNVYRKKYGESITPNVDEYIATKIDRIAGNFDPDYLNQYAQPGDFHVYDSCCCPGKQYYNNSETLACALPLALYNPVNPAAKDILSLPIEYMSTYDHFRIKKMDSSILDIIFYEDDVSRYP